MQLSFWQNAMFYTEYWTFAILDPPHIAIVAAFMGQLN
jgi:hypothetical protein